MHLFRYFLLWCAAVMVSAVFMTEAQANTLHVKGNVVYLERMALPANAKVEVTLDDVSLADAPSRVIARTAFVAKGGSPIPFALKFNPDKLDKRNRYALQARITADSQLLFVTATLHPFFPGKKNDTQIMVQRVSAPANTASAKSFAGKWKVANIAGKAVVGTRPLNIEIASGGRIGGHSGCNGFGGSFTLKGDKVTFSRMAGTLMACSEALMRQEHALYEAFSKARRYELTPQKIKFFNDRGHEILTFVRN